MRYLPIVVAAILPAGHPGADLGAAITPFEPGSQGQIVVAVSLEGHGPFPVLLDTGSSHSVVTSDVMRALGAAPVAKTEIVTPLGTETRLVIRIARVEIGGASTPVLASVVPAGTIDGASRLKGMIGQDVLAHRRFTIDFAEGAILWHDRPPPAEARHALALRAAGARFLVDLPQGGRTLRLVPDSGSEGLVLFDRGDGRLPSLRHTGETRELLTLSGRQRVRAVRVRTLRVGTLELHDLPAVVVRRDQWRDESMALEGDGLLPLHLFERVTFDGPGRRLTLSR